MDQRYEVNGVPLERVRNRQELRVIDHMRVILPQVSGFCGCELCIEDVYAASLSQLPPQYIPLGSFAPRKDHGLDADIDTLVRQVIDKVRTRPNHDTAGAPTSTVARP
jgi:hypothetical protein